MLLGGMYIITFWVSIDVQLPRMKATVYLSAPPPPPHPPYPPPLYCFFFFYLWHIFVKTTAAPSLFFWKIWVCLSLFSHRLCFIFILPDLFSVFRCTDGHRAELHLPQIYPWRHYHKAGRKGRRVSPITPTYTPWYWLQWFCLELSTFGKSNHNFADKIFWQCYQCAIVVRILLTGVT